MDVLHAPHPFSGFDLTAIGLVLVVVMAILGFRRLASRVRRPSEDNPEPWHSQDQEDLHDPR